LLSRSILGEQSDSAAGRGVFRDSQNVANSVGEFNGMAENGGSRGAQLRVGDVAIDDVAFEELSDLLILFG
jgi:hypothetical protein